ncbi:MAG: glycosyltransferase family 2 protein [Myxococcales bacterium]|nr:glycosyltransferase family 2 protein [Myxococcales bacterium]
MEPAKIEVTVIIPCYNLGAYVKEAVESALAQRCPAVEVLVIDDGSRDAATVRVLDELAARRPIRLIRTPNRGVAAARNQGLQEARGEFVCFLDADDRLEPDALATLAAALRSSPEAVLAYPSGYRFGAYRSDHWYPKFNRLRLLTICTIPVPALIRRRLIGPARFRTTARGFEYEDWDFFIQLTAARAAVHVPQVLYGYRERGGSRVDDGLAHHDEVIEDLWRFNGEAFAPAGLLAAKRRWAPAVAIETADEAGHADWRRTLEQQPWLDACLIGDETVVREAKYLLLCRAGAPADGDRLRRCLSIWETGENDALLPDGWEMRRHLALQDSPDAVGGLAAAWAEADLEDWAELDEQLWRLTLPAWTETRLPADLHELAGAPARWRRVRQRLARAGIRRFALFGAGKHPAYLLRRGWLDPRPDLIFDDHSPRAELGGIPVVRPTPENLGRVEAIVVCTDAYERVLYRRAMAAGAGKMPVLRIYT